MKILDVLVELDSSDQGEAYREIWYWAVGEAGYRTASTRRAYMWLANHLRNVSVDATGNAV